ncbi:MAG TPA: arginine--tRNA ligase, partial [Actinospica sp.]|nr:arginine--tRNA ligase [Actinospica sp.]
LPQELAAGDPLVRRSEHADYQSDVALGLAHAAGLPPRQLAASLLDALSVCPASASTVPAASSGASSSAASSSTASAPDGGSVAPAGDSVAPGGVLADAQLSGPGFLNLTLTDAALWSVAAARLADERLGVGSPLAGTRTVVDYSGPNIAKELHVGHIRSTVIGDALVRVLTELGGEVVKANHLGDWGTSFGRLIQYLHEHPEIAWDGAELDALDSLYKASQAQFDADPAFADRARARVVALQSGDQDTLAVWRKLIEVSTAAFQAVYQRLGVMLRPEDAAPESFYNPRLAGIVAQLDAKGLLTESDGAQCVFLDGFANAQGEPLPLLVRKSDGGYGYAATDLAALRYRVEELRADRILYVVDARQSLHLRMVFETGRRAGWLPERVRAVHVVFGSIQGTDGKPFKSRSGETPRLRELLDLATEGARAVVGEKSAGLPAEEVERVVRAAGIGAVKYADLSNARVKDYVFDPRRMAALTGNTSVYLQYAHARACSVLGKVPPQLADLTEVDPTVSPHRAERALILALDGYGAVLEDVAETLEPHRLCTYLYELAKAFSDFWQHCPVLKAEDPAVRGNRIALVRLTGRTFAGGLSLLGIEAPRRL